MKIDLSLLNPIYWPAWLGIGILWLITRLPFSWQMNLGRGLGKFLFFFPTQLKHITAINIALCLPELTPREQQALAQKSFMALGVGIIEAAMAWWLPDHKLRFMYHVSGLEHLEKALMRGKGIILLGPHFTCLEMVGRLLGMHYTFAVMYRPHKKHMVAFIHEKFRQQHYVNYVPSHHIRQLLRVLQNNLPIWYAYDIDGGKKHSVFAPFFGIPTSSLTSASRITALSDAAVIPIHFYRADHEFKYEIVLSPPLEHFPSGDAVADATRLNTLLEKAIREKPEQYIWQYKRFKTRPPGEKRFY